MATQVTIQADGSQAKQEAREVAGALDNIGTEAGQAAAETTQAANRMERQLEQVESQAKETDRAVAGIGGSGLAGKVTAVATSFLAVGQALELGGQAAQGALNAINFLADSGSPAAIRLRDSIGGIQDALVKLADDPRVQGLADQLAGIGDKAAEGIADLPGLYTQAVNGIADAIASGMEAVGLAAEGTTAELDSMQAAEARALQVATERIAAERERLGVVRQQTELAKGLKAIEEASASASRTAALQKISDQAELLRLIEQERAALTSAADAGRLNDDDRAAGLRRLTELESRLQAVRRQGEADTEAAQRRLSEQKAADQKAELDRERQLQRERQEAADRAYQDELRKQQAALEKSGAADALNQKAADPREIAKRLADSRAEDKRSQLELQGADPRAIEREVEQARRQGFRNAMQQHRGGRQEFSQEEVGRAQQENVNAQIQTLRDSGRFSNAMLDGLAMATQAQTQQGVELRAMQDQLAEINRQLNSNQQDNQRRRSQRNSNRQ